MSDPGPVRLPLAVATAIATLVARGHRAHLVGPAVRALLAGEPVRDFEVATTAEAGALLALFPMAIPLDAVGRRLVLPTSAGPVDLVPYRCGGDLLGELAHRDFTIHALAADANGRVLDPFAGQRDARAARLRCVGHAAERFAEDPLRMLRAVRLVATDDLTADLDMVAALRDARARITAIPAAPLRAELHVLLLGRAVERGLALLRECGLEAELAPGVAPDSARVVGALPPDLELRLAGWLRGTRVVRILRRLREPWPRVIAVERLLHLHPIDGIARPEPDPALRRLVRRSRSLWPGLLALRGAEIAARGEGAAARERLERLRQVFEQASAPPVRFDVRLALGGRAVMEILGCGPGPEVGRALQQLAKAVAADPACNTADGLRERLLAWRSAAQDD